MFSLCDMNFLLHLSVYVRVHVWVTSHYVHKKRNNDKYLHDLSAPAV